MRIGYGYDVHRLTPGRKLVLGGMSIPFEYGLLGHSDADVLTHAIIDALLGAAGMGDIGRLFPDTDDSYKGISSLLLLERVAERLTDAGYRLVNMDCTVIAQAPKLAPYIEQMESNICDTLGIDISERMVNIKATTEEGLGFTGDGSGIAAKAVCLIDKV